MFSSSWALFKSEINDYFTVVLGTLLHHILRLVRVVNLETVFKFLLFCFDLLIVFFDELHLLFDCRIVFLDVLLGISVQLVFELLDKFVFGRCDEGLGTLLLLQTLNFSSETVEIWLHYKNLVAWSQGVFHFVSFCFLISYFKDHQATITTSWNNIPIIMSYSEFFNSSLVMCREFFNMLRQWHSITLNCSWGSLTIIDTSN